MNDSRSEIKLFLVARAKVATERAVWGNGTLPLEIVSYLGEGLPPLELITSVRSLIFRGDSILVMRNEGGTHIIAGGRREAGESLEVALRREVLEEAGWRVTVIRQLGFMHLHHLAPKRTGYAFPHPDFFWVVYMAEADCFDQDAKLPDDYEREAKFTLVTEARSLDLSPSQRVFLDAALPIRGRR